MKIKESVNLSGMRPELIVGLMIANEIYTRHEDTLTLTSVTDGKHMDNSLHYAGLAVDIRLPINATTNYVAAELQERLGPQWDVVREVSHIHIEYDPK